MKAKLIGFVMAGVITLAPVVGAVPALAAPKPPGPEPTYISDDVRDWEATPERINLTPDEEPAEPTTSTALTDCTLDSKYFLILDDYNGFYDFAEFDLVADTDGSQIWVQSDLSWPAGDPRSAPEISCEQAAYMAGEFDDNIYPTEIDYFGSPDAHDGSASLLEAWGYVPPGYYADSAGRQIVLVSNVRDDNFYDPDYPLYIAGFYSSTLEAYFDRNVMTIDAYDWANRTGPSGTRPFLYEGVFAHEYQHLLHDDYDSGEETFINEGLSDFAMVLTGYEVALTSHLGPAATNPENSLVSWGDQGDLEILTDYGQAALFQMYLNEQFGQDFTQRLFHDPGHGISGVEHALDPEGSRNFADVYHDFSVALLIDSAKPRAGRYQIRGADIHVDMGTPDAPNPEAFDTPGAPPWGTDYLWIENPGDVARFSFNGSDFSMFPTAWSSDGDVLWSGSGDLLDNWAIFEADGGGTLTFDTKYDLEETWDFGFVQVSTDGGHSWTSLGNADTRSDHDPSAHPKVVDNIPGFTGSTGGEWVSESFDLSPYAGEEILVAFRCVTDWSFFEDGWFIDNVMVDDELISDGSSTHAFRDLSEILPTDNDFTVTFVGTKESRNGTQYKVATVKIDHQTESFLVQLQPIFAWADQAAMLVTFDAPEGVTTYADYTYGFEEAGAAAAREAGANKK